MKIIRSVGEFLSVRKTYDAQPPIKIGLVPTMGALHQGHLSLVKKARQENDLVIVSLFVNPTQFDKKEDLEKYPRNLKEDADLLEKNNVDILFAPDSNEVYGSTTFLQFSFGALENVMEGEFRDGHFNGVATIVSKLFNYVRPTRAYFGQKDLQQVAVIKDLTSALSFNLEVVRCEIVRDRDGLALSSRNARLSLLEKRQAITLSETIFMVRDCILTGKPTKEAISTGLKHYKETLNLAPEYLEVVYANTLKRYDDAITQEELAVCIAGYVGPVRLIDNVVFIK